MTDYIKDRSGRQFDPKAVAAFLEILANGYPIAKEETAEPSSVTPAF